MSLATSIKQERINLRLQQVAKNTLERAAGFEGKTVSNFILISAMERAQKTIQEHETMHLNGHDSVVFFNALAKPEGFNQKLMSAFEDYDERVISQ